MRIVSAAVGLIEEHPFKPLAETIIVAFVNLRLTEEITAEQFLAKISEGGTCVGVYVGIGVIVGVAVAVGLGLAPNSVAVARGISGVLLAVQLLINIGITKMTMNAKIIPMIKPLISAPSFFTTSVCKGALKKSFY